MSLNNGKSLRRLIKPSLPAGDDEVRRAAQFWFAYWSVTPPDDFVELRMPGFTPPPVPVDLVIPVLNEELRIGRTLTALAAHVAAGDFRSA